MKTLYSPTLYLIRGVPGSGKSTFAQELKQRGVVDVVFEADRYFYDQFGDYNFDPSKLAEAHRWCLNSTISSLDVGSNVAVSNTLTTEKELEPYLRAAESMGVNVVSLIVENRHGSSNVHNVPEETIARMKQRFSVKL